MKNFQAEVSSIFRDAQARLTDADGRKLDIQTIVSSVDISRRSYYSALDSRTRTTKETLLRLAIAFELSAESLIELCNLKGYLYPHNRTDEIVISLFQQGVPPDVSVVDEVLIAAGERPIFSVRTR